MDLIDLDESPSERLARVGAAGLSDIELVSLLLGPGKADGEARRTARGLLDDLGGLSGLTAFEGKRRLDAGPQSSILLATLELARRLARTRITRRRVLDVPGAVAAYLALRYSSEDQEILGALFLDTCIGSAGNRLLGFSTNSLQLGSGGIPGTGAAKG